MNTQLVDYLVGVITNLTPEEQILLDQKLKAKNWLQQRKELHQLQEEIFNKRQGKPLFPDPEDVIYQMREERNSYYDNFLNINQEVDS